MPTPCPFTARRRPARGGIRDVRRCRGEGSPRTHGHGIACAVGAAGPPTPKGSPAFVLPPAGVAAPHLRRAVFVSCTLWARVLNPFCRGSSRRNEGTGDTSTGFIKNFAHIQEPGANEQRFLTTYKRVNDEREERIRTTGAQGGCDGRVQWRCACSATVHAGVERSGMRTCVALH